MTTQETIPTEEGMAALLGNSVGTISARTGRPRKKHIGAFSARELRQLGWDGSTYFSHSQRKSVPYISGHDSDSDDSYEPLDGGGRDGGGSSSGGRVQEPQPAPSRAPPTLGQSGKVCSSCKTRKGKAGYSKRQWSNQIGDARRCMSCINSQSDGTSSAAAPPPSAASVPRAAAPLPSSSHHPPLSAAAAAAAAVPTPAVRPASEETKIQFRIHFDGGARPNPGVGGCGALFEQSTDYGRTWRLITKKSWRLGNSCTNNQAEYLGLIYALMFLKDTVRSPPGESIRIKVCGDSDLVVKQLRGEFAVSAQDLLVLHRIAKSLVGARTVDTSTEFEETDGDRCKSCETKVGTFVCSHPLKGQYVLLCDGCADRIQARYYYGNPSPCAIRYGGFAPYEVGSSTEASKFPRTHMGSPCSQGCGSAHLRIAYDEHTNEYTVCTKCRKFRQRLRSWNKYQDEFTGGPSGPQVLDGGGLCGLSVSVEHVPRGANQAADAEATKAITASLAQPNVTMFRPNLGSYSYVKVAGQGGAAGRGRNRVAASNDFRSLGASGWCLIDAAFLLDAFGEGAAPSSIADLECGAASVPEGALPSKRPHFPPRVVTTGNQQLEVLGLYRKPLEILFRLDGHHESAGDYVPIVLKTGVLVVHKLPVPMHVSMAHKDIEPLQTVGLFGGLTMSRGTMLSKNVFPASYRGHQYWQDHD